MAQVDFSHAVLEPYEDSKPLTWDYLNLDTTNSIFNRNGQGIGTGSRSIITNTPTKVSFLFAGTFSASGTEFLMGNYTVFRVSNISFSVGDSYSFIIDIETSGNV